MCCCFRWAKMWSHFSMCQLAKEFMADFFLTHFAIFSHRFLVQLSRRWQADFIIGFQFGKMGQFECCAHIFICPACTHTHTYTTQTHKVRRRQYESDWRSPTLKSTFYLVSKTLQALELRICTLRNIFSIPFRSKNSICHRNKEL